jgi:hypothetical protein
MQYLLFLKNAASGDLGKSFVYGRPALEVIFERMPATLELATVAMLISILVGIPLGLYAGLKPDSKISKAIMAISIVGFSLPTFWVGLMLIMLFAGGALTAAEPSPESRLTVKGGRFLTLSTVIRVNQIEAARNLNEGEDEAGASGDAAASSQIRIGSPAQECLAPMPSLPVHPQTPSMWCRMSGTFSDCPIAVGQARITAADTKIKAFMWLPQPAW